MKKLILLCVCCIMCASLSAKTIRYEVGPFDQLALNGNIDIIYTSNPDSIGLATYESEEDFSDAIEITNNKGHLSIKEVQGHDLGHLPTIHVYSDFLSKVSNEGNADITLNLSAATPTFSASLVGNGGIICRGVKSTDVSASITTGNGTIVLRGKCTNANFKLTGTGIIQADGLSARNVKCFGLGTGTIGCNASEKLDVRGVGSTKIYYIGDPTIKKVGGAKLIRISESPEDLPEEGVATTVVDDDTEVDEVVSVTEETTFQESGPEGEVVSVTEEPTIVEVETADEMISETEEPTVVEEGETE